MRIPITVRFEIPYFTVSGVQVRYLKIVEKSGYQGPYGFRLSSHSVNTSPFSKPDTFFCLLRFQLCLGFGTSPSRVTTTRCAQYVSLVSFHTLPNAGNLHFPFLILAAVGREAKLGHHTSVSG